MFYLVHYLSVLSKTITKLYTEFNKGSQTKCFRHEVTNVQVKIISFPLSDDYIIYN